MSRPPPDASPLRESQLSLEPRAYRDHGEKLVRFFGPGLRTVMQAADRFRTARVTFTTWLRRYEQDAGRVPGDNEQPEVTLTVASQRLRKALRELGASSPSAAAAMRSWEADLDAEIERLRGRLAALRTAGNAASQGKPRDAQVPPRPSAKPPGSKRPIGRSSERPSPSARPRARSWRPGRQPPPKQAAAQPKSWRPGERVAATTSSSPRSNAPGSRRPFGRGKVKSGPAPGARPVAGEPRVTTLTAASGGQVRSTREALELLGLHEPTLDTVKLRKRYKDLTRKHHPDRGGCARKMVAINSAYSRIKNRRVKLRRKG